MEDQTRPPVTLEKERRARWAMLIRLFQNDRAFDLAVWVTLVILTVLSFVSLWR